MRAWRALVATAAAFASVGALTLVPSPAANAVRAAECVSPVSPDGSAVLTDDLHGAAAVNALGDDLSAVAASEGVAASTLRTSLINDPTLWVNTCGALYYVEPTTSGTAETANSATAIADPMDLSQTFALSSDPDANRTIYLDFTGYTMQDNGVWGSYGISNGMYASPYDNDGDPTTFSDAEMGQIQKVWARVAEDYAPFKINVTTAEPTFDALDRSSVADQTYGTRVVITGSDSIWQRACNSKCGGIAYVGVFDQYAIPNQQQPHSYYQPAWVFTGGTGNGAKYVAEAASHEVGHTLGLLHDGRTTPSEEYYWGQGAWAPIMGASYYNPVTQWNPGDYANASRREDDLAVMQTVGAPLRADDVGDTIAVATELTAGSPLSRIITTRTDVDVFSFTADGVTSLVANPAILGANLDIKMTLYDSNGTFIEVNNPDSSTLCTNQAGGLSARITRNLVAGTYFVAIDGVGVGNPLATGYSDYGSLGRYTLSLAAGVIAAPMSPLCGLSIYYPTSMTVSWVAPEYSGDSPITGYDVTLQPGSHTCTTTTTSCAFSDLSSGVSYVISLVAKNATTNSPPVRIIVQTTVVPPATPTQVALTAGVASAHVEWLSSADEHAPAVTYVATLLPGGTVCTTLSKSCDFTGLTPGATYTATVVARNFKGDSASVTSNSVVIPTVPSAPVTVHVEPGLRSATVTWTPGSDGGMPITAYTVRVANSQSVCTTSTSSCVVEGLMRGTTYDFTVTATNAVGDSQAGPAVTAVTLTEAPSAPTLLTAVAGDQSITATWDGPSDSGGASVTSYTVTAVGPSGTSTCTAVAPAVTCAVQGLVEDGNYDVSVVAHNGQMSLSSNTISVLLVAPVTPPQQPLPPSRVSATLLSNGTVWVSWPTGAPRGPEVTGYQVLSSPDGAVCTVVQGPTVRWCGITGLRTGVSYTFTVAARNSEGLSDESVSSNSVLVLSVPSAPRNVVVSPPTITGGAQPRTFSAVVSWDVPLANGGASIDRYVVTSVPSAGVTCSVPTERVSTCSGLRAGTSYRFRVVAVNARGASPYAVTSAIMTQNVPGRPTGVVVSRHGTSALVTWSAVGSGGAPITAYTVVAGPNGTSCRNTSGPQGRYCTVRGLDRQLQYTFTVTATNALGTGSPSVAVRG